VKRGVVKEGVEYNSVQGTYTRRHPGKFRNGDVRWSEEHQEEVPNKDGEKKG